MPPHTVKVDRTTRWGNPFIANPLIKPAANSGASFVCVPTIEDAVAAFEEMVLQTPPFLALIRRELAGKNLACWCKPDAPCHADVLLRIANDVRGPGGKPK